MLIKKTLSTVAIASLVLGGLSYAETFKYNTFGGYLKGTEKAAPSHHYTSPAKDGPVFREGNFSKAAGQEVDKTSLPWGDQDSHYNKKDARSIHPNSWPAMTWGDKKNTDPWITPIPSTIPPVSDLPGGSGIGTTGYGYDAQGGAASIVVGDSSKFAPLGSFTHFNYVINFYGSMEVGIEWNLELYESDGTTKIGDKWPRHHHFTLNHWETYNLADACPRNQFANGDPAAAGTDVNDTKFNTAVTEGGKPIDPVGLGNIFVRDGNTIDNTNYGCSDPFSFSYTNSADGLPLTVLPSGALQDTFDYNGKQYEIIYTGFYENDDADPECIEEDYGRKANWDKLSCFIGMPTVWSAENKKHVGYVRMQINQISTGDQGCTPGYWKLFVKKPNKHIWPTGISPDDKFSTVFGCVPPANPDITLGKAVSLGGGGENALLRHAVAALLNAKSSVDYAYTETKVKTMTCDALNGTGTLSIEETKNLFDKANNGVGGCPLN